MDIKQDPNSIPNFGSGGRIGELSANEPEQVQSSVELDREDGADDGSVPAGAGPESPAATTNAAEPTLAHVQVPTMAEAGGLPVDKSKTGEGAIDALVGAP